MTFQVGDAVVHPARGAGIIADIKEFGTDGNIKRYYQIKMARKTSTNLMIPIGGEENLGIRPAVSVSNLPTLWEVLAATPQSLPDKHKIRYKVIGNRLDSGDVLKIAEAVRDMAWRGHQEEGFTTKGRRIFKKGLRLLTEELAVSLKIGPQAAEEQILEKLNAAFEAMDSSAAEVAES